MPAPLTDAASATPALLRTATVIRLENGDLWGWEGEHTRDGSCEGSCTHVWNCPAWALEAICSQRSSARCARPSGNSTSCPRAAHHLPAEAAAPLELRHYRDCAAEQAFRRPSSRPSASGGSRVIRPGSRPTGRRRSRKAMDSCPRSAERTSTAGTERSTRLFNLAASTQTLDMELFEPNCSGSARCMSPALLAMAKMAEALGEAELARRVPEARRERRQAYRYRSSTMAGSSSSRVDLGDKDR